MFKSRTCISTYYTHFVQFCNYYSYKFIRIPIVIIYTISIYLFTVFIYLSILFYSYLFYSILFYSILFYSILFYSILSGNIASDISDHYSQFCFVHGVKVIAVNSKISRRDYSQFSGHDFVAELAEINWDTVVTTEQGNINRSFSTFYNKVNKVVDKHAPLKTLSRRRTKQLSKPWITRGIRKSIRVKNSLYLSGNKELYRIYRNKILNISR